MYINLVLILCVIKSVYSNLNLEEGANCTRDDVNGRCVGVYRCLSTYRDIKTKSFPPVCNFQGNDPVVCCTDCDLVDNFKNDVRGKVLEPNKTGDKAHDYCIQMLHTLDYPCKKALQLTVERRHNKEANCFKTKLIQYTVTSFRIAFTEGFSHMVMLGYGADEESAQWKCGGSIISDKFILTAAHCTTHPEFGPVKFAGVGVRKRTDPPSMWTRYAVKRSILHPEYKPPAKYHDIALLETAKSITFKHLVRPICLSEKSEQIQPAVKAIGIGGITRRGQKTPDNPYILELKPMTEEECMERYPPSEELPQGYNSTIHKCYGSKTQLQGPCFSDAGSAIFIPDSIATCSFSLLGLTSFKRTCTLYGGTGLYTNVFFYKSWIEGIVWPDDLKL